jgi:hypothetical protein
MRTRRYGRRVSGGTIHHRFREIKVFCQVEEECYERHETKPRKAPRLVHLHEFM